MADLLAHRSRLRAALKEAPAPRPSGRLIEVTGTTIKAQVPGARIGMVCHFLSSAGDPVLEAEVVGFQAGATILTAMGDIAGLGQNSEVIAGEEVATLSVSDELRGRVIDSRGRCLEGMPRPGGASRPAELYRAAPSPMTRSIISDPFVTGLRVLDGVLTMGRGQRVGVFGPAGTGKSHFIAALCKAPSADVIVIALVGERGREVREFCEHILTPEARAKTIVVVETSDAPAAMRARAVYSATTIAEDFRDQGLNVLLVVDSLTRTARALREVGLSAGEPMGRGGWPNSVFSKLAPLLERAGPASKGSITAIYTVLTEGEEVEDPLAEEIRSILDGHVILSKELAREDHFPAIDILSSRSRLMNAITDEAHQKCASGLRKLVADYDEIQFLMRVGEYTPGNDANADRAVDLREEVLSFLQQTGDDVTSFELMREDLAIFWDEGV